MSEYSVDQLRVMANNPALLERERDALNAYADLLERIEADERSGPFGPLDEWMHVRNPPAQTAQVDDDELRVLPADRVVEDVEQNSARYRFIRDEQATIIYKRKQDGEWEPLVDTYSTSTRCASLDTAIDTAMLAAALKERGNE